MEFEQNTVTDRSPDIDDTTRLAAATRSTTLTPIHKDIVPDDATANGNSPSRAASAAVPNISIDTEATTTPTIPNPTAKAIAIDRINHSRSHRRTWIITSLICGVVIATLAYTYLILQH